MGGKRAPTRLDLAVVTCASPTRTSGACSRARAMTTDSGGIALPVDSSSILSFASAHPLSRNESALAAKADRHHIVDPNITNTPALAPTEVEDEWTTAYRGRTTPLEVRPNPFAECVL